MERWDRLRTGGYRFVYDDALFPPGTDSFLLSAFPKLRPGLRICDLGCGTGLLGLLLVPDKANALLYLLFFGLWPMLKSLLERIPARPLEWLCKLAVFNAVLSLFWFGLHSLFLPFLPETLQAPWMVYAAGNAAFVIYDVGFSKLISFYVARVDRVLRKTS